MELTYTERNGVMYPDLVSPSRPITPSANTEKCVSTTSKSTAAAPIPRFAKQMQVRICRSKIGVLAHQAKGARIFAWGEYPVTSTRKPLETLGFQGFLLCPLRSFWGDVTQFATQIHGTPRLLCFLLNICFLFL